MKSERPKLSDILNGDASILKTAWAMTAAAADFAPLPAGEYIARVVSGELVNSKTKRTPGFKLTCEVVDGEFQGRRIWIDMWLTAAAVPSTKRDLLKIGVTDLEQLERPLPSGILLRVKLALRRDDQGNETNRVTRFDYHGIEQPDAFAPADDNGRDDSTTDRADEVGVDGADGVEAAAATDHERKQKLRHPRNGELPLTPDQMGPYGGDRR